MSLDTLPSVPVHPAEELLEEYSFGRVTEPALAPLEEHLLECELCQSRLLAIDEYTVLMKAGIIAFERERLAAVKDRPRFPFLGFSAMSGALATASLLLLVSGMVAWRILPLPPADSSPAIVRLVALRGGGNSGAAQAPSGRLLDLVFDRTDLPATFGYRLEVISSTGRQVWEGAVQVADDRISARLTKALRPGVYWARLYSPDGQLRREFGLRVE